MIPWPTSAHLGDGVLAPGGTLKTPAVPVFEATAGQTHQRRSRSMVAASASDLSEMLHVEAAGHFHTPSISGHAKAEYEDSVKISDRSQTVVYQITVEWDPSLGPRDLLLTANAETVASTHPEQFRDFYGDYVVAGYVKAAELVVFARLTSKDTEITIDVYMSGLKETAEPQRNRGIEDSPGTSRTSSPAPWARRRRRS
jgi:hypothetical protein